MKNTYLTDKYLDKKDLLNELEKVIMADFSEKE